jgi:hypothetical protein
MLQEMTPTNSAAESQRWYFQKVRVSEIILGIRRGRWSVVIWRRRKLSIRNFLLIAQFDRLIIPSYVLIMKFIQQSATLPGITIDLHGL